MTPFLPVRSTMKSSPRHRAEVELNLIPLIDILSVMVAFLLVYTTNVEVVQNAKGVEIPQSTADVQPKQSVVVMITKDQLFVQNELIATIAEIRESGTPLIEPLRAVLERPMLDEHGASVGEWRARDTRDHGAGRQVPAVRRREESDGDVYCGLLRQDFTGGHREGKDDRRCRPEQGLEAQSRSARPNHSQVQVISMEAATLDAVTTQDLEELLAQAREKLEGLVRELRAIDARAR